MAKNLINKAFLAITIISPVLFSFCKPQEVGEYGLSFRSTITPDARGGQTFLNVKSSDKWRLYALYTEDTKQKWLKFTPSEGSGNITAVVTFKSNTEKDDRKAEIVLVSNGHKVRLNVTQPGNPDAVQEHKPGGGESGGVEPGGEPGGGEYGGVEPGSGTGGSTGSLKPEKGKYGYKTAYHRWMELPVTYSNDGREFFSHRMTIDNVDFRNYSFYWDYKYKVALWVAYPLNPWTIGVYRKRCKNCWSYDPLLPQEEQPNITIGSYNGPYDRGHQLPSADRLGTRDRNASTFYSTNMTAQSSELNRGIWGNLEMAVRERLANRSDTLYVVTGCIIGKNPDYTTDKQGMKVVIPAAYYKALLFYSNNSTLGKYKGFSGCGVYMENSPDIPYNEPLSDFTMSIAELEKKTGQIFFSNLPALIGKEDAANVKNQHWIPW